MFNDFENSSDEFIFNAADASDESTEILVIAVVHLQKEKRMIPKSEH